MPAHIEDTISKQWIWPTNELHWTSFDQIEIIASTTDSGEQECRNHVLRLLKMCYLCTAVPDKKFVPLAETWLFGYLEWRT